MNKTEPMFSNILEETVYIQEVVNPETGKHYIQVGDRIQIAGCVNPSGTQLGAEG